MPFDDAYEEKVIFTYKKIPIPIINKEHLVISKSNTNNSQDINDIRLLQENA